MVSIFIEAKDKKTPEAKFLTAILDRMGISPEKYFLAPTGGYTNLLDSNNAANANAMRANTDAGGKNLVIFDAEAVIITGVSRDAAGICCRKETKWAWTLNCFYGLTTTVTVMWRCSWNVLPVTTCILSSLTVSASMNAASPREKLVMVSRSTVPLTVRASYTHILLHFLVPVQRRANREVVIGSGTMVRYGISIQNH